MARLEAEMAELRRRKASRMPGPQGQRRKPGKQKGAKGHNRRQVAKPDEEVGVEPAECDDCGANLCRRPGAAGGQEAGDRVFTPPPPRVVQYNVAERRCPCCGKVNQGG